MCTLHLYFLSGLLKWQCKIMVLLDTNGMHDVILGLTWLYLESDIVLVLQATRVHCLNF